ncbi:MAG: FxsA family protein [Dehalococcoidia bacterium]|nr:MAG: FxsA family protein [Dehalococcoidia bacterium]
MFFKLALLFILMPLIELAILVYLGTQIGALYTILIVIGTGLVGAFMARDQGLATLSRIRSSLERGVVPSSELFHGALILVGGLLLLTPGLITDTVGFLLLIPPTRYIIGRWLRSRILGRIQRHEIHFRDIQ